MWYLVYYCSLAISHRCLKIELSDRSIAVNITVKLLYYMYMDTILWWHYGLEKLPSLLTLCERNPAVFSTKGPVMDSFNALSLLQASTSCSTNSQIVAMWRHCNVRSTGQYEKKTFEIKGGSNYHLVVEFYVQRGIVPGIRLYQKTERKGVTDNCRYSIPC